MQRHRLPPQTLQLTSSPRASLDDIRWLAENRDGSCALFAGGKGTALSSDERTALLAKVRAGEPVELELEAVTYIQRDTPNRNFVRFKPSILASFAKSFAGQPVLRDHNSRSMTSRGGTIMSSKLVHNEDGTKSIAMRLKLVKAWAVESALDGTLDRFSIGWNRTGAIECSICDAGISECLHWPGDKEGEAVCEFVFTGAEGTEVSGVNVPAVVGTGIQAITQLSGIDDPGLLADIRRGDATRSADATQEKNAMKIMLQLATILGVASSKLASVTEEDVLEAAQARADELTIVKTQLAEAKAVSATLTKDATDRAAADRAAIIETGIQSLIATGKLKPSKDEKSMEQSLRRMGGRDTDTFAVQVKEMLEGPSVTPVGAKLPALGADPVAGAGTTKAFLSANPVVSAWLAKAGINEADFDKFGAGARSMHEQMAAQR